MSDTQLVTTPNSIRIESEPSWLPDSSGIVYAGMDEGFSNDPSQLGTVNIYKTTLAGLTTQLTHAGAPVVYGDYSPIVSPDGTQVAFARQHWLGSQTVEEIHVLSGSSDTLLTTLAAGDYLSTDRPIAWTQDGEHLVISVATTGTSNNFLMEINLADGTTNLVSTLDGQVSTPLVSTNGTLIYYWRPIPQTPGTDTSGGIVAQPLDGSSNPHMLIASNSGITPYSFLSPEPTAPSLIIVALGDSVAAGEGINYGYEWNGTKWVGPANSNPGWKDTTASLGANYQACHYSRATWW